MILIWAPHSTVRGTLPVLVFSFHLLPLLLFCDASPRVLVPWNSMRCNCTEKAVRVNVAPHPTFGCSQVGRGWIHPCAATSTSRMFSSISNNPSALFIRGGRQAEAVIATDVKKTLDSTEKTSAKEKGDDDNIGEESSIDTKWYFPAQMPGDGHETDPDGIPRRFLDMQKGHRKHAMEAFQKTLAWRKERKMDTTLGRPHPTFDTCKTVFPHFLAGQDRHGHIVFVQRPGKICFDTAHRNSLSLDDMLMHFCYVMEYIWNIAQPGEPGKMISIIDVSGVSFSLLGNREKLSFIKQFVHLISVNYPGRSYKTFVINCPKWFNAVYNLIKPLLRESTKKKIEILNGGSLQEKRLHEYLGDTCADTIHTEPDQQTQLNGLEGDFRDFCIQRLKEAGAELQQVVVK